jgi:hypothetical protein
MSVLRTSTEHTKSGAKKYIFVSAITLVSLIISASASSAQPLPINPAVTQENINQTICVRGFTKTIRPPVEYTNSIKLRLLAEQGLPPEAADDYKLDHRINLSIGGAPSDLHNLVLQANNESHDKDRVELCLSRSVCAGRITLQQAQSAIWNNWRTAASLCSGYRAIGSDE